MITAGQFDHHQGLGEYVWVNIHAHTYQPEGCSGNEYRREERNLKVLCGVGNILSETIPNLLYTWPHVRSDDLQADSDSSHLL